MATEAAAIMELTLTGSGRKQQIPQRNTENYYSNFDVRIVVDKKTYEFRIWATKEQYNYILNTLSNDETYQKTSSKIKNKDIFAVQLNGDASFVSKDTELYNKIMDNFQNSTTIRNENSNSLFSVEFSIYDNYEVNKIYFDINNNQQINEEILNYYNAEVKKAFDNPDINIYSYFIGEYNIETYTTSEDYFSNYYQNEYMEINNFILDNLDEKIDINKPYMYIKFYTHDRYKNSNIFVTNKIEELKELVNKIKQKEAEENYIGDTDGKYTY